jgi:transketolase
LRAGGGLYRWHAGAPDDESFQNADEELASRVRERARALGLGEMVIEATEPPPKVGSGVSNEFVVEAFGDKLVELGQRHPNLVVLDGDLSADCRLRKFEHAFPERFIENGIAEQDMVSMAGGMARHGMLPVVNSFGTFLAARANEQIYNNCSEDSRVVYVCHLAGIVPAGPGKSHQSIRDISLFRALPNCIIVEPCCGSEAGALLEYAVERSSESVMLRLVIGPSPRRINPPVGYEVVFGQGAVLAPGDDVVVFSSGPVLLHEILGAAEALSRAGVSVKVVDMPWLNRVDLGWLDRVTAGCRAMVVVENHSPEGGLGDTLLSAMTARNGRPRLPIFKIGVTGYPMCGAPGEVLAFHKLDAVSLTERLAAIAEAVGIDSHELDTGSIPRIEVDAPIG